MLTSDPNQLSIFVLRMVGSSRTNQLQQLGFVEFKISPPGRKMTRNQHVMNYYWICKYCGPELGVLYSPLEMSNELGSRTGVQDKDCGLPVFDIKHMVESSMPYAPWVSRLHFLSLRVLIHPPEF